MSKIFHKKERREEEAAPQVEEIPSVQNEAQIPADNKCRTMTHINSYPLVQQTKHILRRFPPTRVVLSNTKPIIIGAVTSKPMTLVRPVTGIADRVFDKTLSVTEMIVPSMKTKTYQRLGEEIMLPYTITKTVAQKTTSTAKYALRTYFFEPTHEQVLKFRKYYNEKIIDTHGKPLIRGTLDCIVGPVNRRYESLIIKVLPEGKPVPTTGFTNECDRNLALTCNMIGRLGPAAVKKTSAILFSPCNYVKHVNDVFNDNLDRLENLQWANSWKAAKNAIAELNGETLEHVKNFIPGNRTKPANGNGNNPPSGDTDMVTATVVDPDKDAAEKASEAQKSVPSTE
ncbi:HDL518Wp [Eremothecium sinecaudum]|uniref:HDL518Wp n=1 Tax=Eremothecium sinecaudum TaxID=45286 RepID=A0A0X8HRQ9_9SACH|nr:HDL518Wp [Eremothecium sinecaudum]AMD20226.1 HDL518Wp [Eremothecium sinecaudum]